MSGAMCKCNGSLNNACRNHTTSPVASTNRIVHPIPLFIPFHCMIMFPSFFSQVFEADPANTLWDIDAEARFSDVWHDDSPLPSPETSKRASIESQNLTAIRQSLNSTKVPLQRESLRHCRNGDPSSRESPRSLRARIRLRRIHVTLLMPIRLLQMARLLKQYNMLWCKRR
jgi:hypothetical protein